MGELAKSAWVWEVSRRSGHVSKPIDVNELVRLIARVVSEASS
jgi:hypothetical protein